MAVVSWRHRFLFVQAPRTGCTAIARGVLVPQLDGRHIPERPVYDEQGRLVVDRKHATLRQMLLHEFLTHEQACRLFKFSTVRNPFDSVLSEYVKQRSTYQPLLGNPNTWVQSRPAYKEAMHYATEHSFEEWLERSWARRFPRSLKRRYETASGALAWQDGMDFVMRFERLQQDFDEVMRRLGLASVTIPRLNETTGRDRDYRSAYTRKARRIVEKVYAPLLERYDYAF